MAALTKLVAYELYTLEHSGWTLHGRYTSAEMNDAVNEAKTIEATMQRATKLVRETYYPDDNRTDEAVVRISPNLAEYKRRLAAMRQQRPARTGGGRGGNADAFVAPQAAAQPHLGTPQILARMVMAVLSALVVAAAITSVIALVLRLDVIASRLPASATPPLLFASFIGVFLLAALPLVSRYLPEFATKADAEDSGAPDSQAFLNMPGHPEPPPPDETAPPPAGEPALFKDDPGLIARETPQQTEDALAEAPAPPPEPDRKAEEKARKEKEKQDKAKKEKEKQDKAAEPEPEIETPPEIAAIAALERQRIVMMRFLTGILTVLKDVCPQLDAYNKFGLNLILAGACIELGRREDLREKDVLALTAEAVAMLGTKPALTESFCRKLEVHAAEPRYAAMIEHGAHALGDFISGGSPFEAVAAAMAAWNRPGGRITGSNIVTILFTDMVGSTKLTQDVGDDAAQTTVRLHNAIVRAVLAAHQGSEVKHTGDGIMASFAAPSSAVEAAAAIQHAVRAHNLANPGQELHLRIGINSGEPIVEDDDLFGTAVQLAARVCAEAEVDGVLVGNVVRELTAGKGYPMRALPPRRLRGIAEAQVLHVVDWAAMAPAAPPAGAVQAADALEQNPEAPTP